MYLAFCRCYNCKIISKSLYQIHIDENIRINNCDRSGLVHFFFTYQPVPDLCVVVAMASACHSTEIRGSCFLKLILLQQKCLKNLLSCVHWQIVFRLNKHKNLISEECVSQFFLSLLLLKKLFRKIYTKSFLQTVFVFSQTTPLTLIEFYISFLRSSYGGLFIVPIQVLHGQTVVFGNACA